MFLVKVNPLMVVMVLLMTGEMVNAVRDNNWKHVTQYSCKVQKLGDHVGKVGAEPKKSPYSAGAE